MGKSAFWRGAFLPAAFLTDTTTQNRYTAYAALVRNSHPLVFWRFGDPVGTTVVDSSGNARTGTVTSTPIFDQVSAFEADPNKAIAFDGVDDFISNSHSSLKPTAGPLSLEVWTRVQTATTGADMGMAGNGHLGIQLALDRPDPSTNRVKVFVGHSTAVISYDFAKDTVTHHFLTTWDGTTGTGGVKLYIDGVLVATGTASSATLAPVDDFRAARYGSNYLNGVLDEVALYPVEITAVVAAIHASFRYYTSRVHMIVDEQHRSNDYLHDSLDIADQVGETPGTCSFQTPPNGNGWVPLVFNRVQIFHQGAPRLLFSGTILTTEDGYEESPTNHFTRVNAVDDVWILNHKFPVGFYEGESATDIVEDLGARYTPDTPLNVEQGLPVIDRIAFFGDDTLGDCLSRVAKLIGAVWRRDFEDEGLFFGLVDTEALPRILDSAHLSLESFKITRTGGAIVTRVRGSGGSAQLMSDVASGETIIPVEDTFWYLEAGGLLRITDQILSHTGLDVGGAGSLIGTGASPSALEAVAADGAGCTSGDHEVSVVFVTGAGQSLPGPRVTVAVGVVAPPSVTPVASAPTVGSGATSGQHRVAVSFVNAAGETTPGPRSNIVTPGPATTGLIDPSPVAPGLTASPSSGGNNLVTVRYGITFINGVGETQLGPTADIQVVGTEPPSPSSPSYEDLGSGALLGTGTYNWAMTAVNADGTETPVGGGISGGSSAPFNVRFNFMSPSSFGCAAYRLYRTESNGAVLKFSKQTASSSSTSLLDNVADGSLGSTAPTINATYQSVTVVLQGGGLGTTGRRVYAWDPYNLSQLKLVATISNNTLASYVDANPRDGTRLGAAAPSTNTTATVTNYNVIPVTLEIGPSNVTARKVWMTHADDPEGTLYLVATVANNNAVSYNIATADGSLVTAAPGSNTATASQIGLTEIPIGPAAVTSREIYMTPANTPGGTMRLAQTIADNTTLTGTITMSDATLAGQAAAPSTDTSGLAQPAGVVVAGSTSIPVAGTAPFRTSGGWAMVQSIPIRYTSFSGGSLTGVPSSSPGALTSNVSSNASIVALPVLIGIPPSGEGSISHLIPAGEQVRIYVVLDNEAAQAELADALGTDGIVEVPFDDDRLAYATLIERCQSILDLRSTVEPSIDYEVRDPEIRTGATQEVDLDAPTNAVGDFIIQSVSISSFVGNTNPDVFPKYSVRASHAGVSGQVPAMDETFMDLLKRR